jgi:hypothetical protein
MRPAGTVDGCQHEYLKRTKKKGDGAVLERTLDEDHGIRDALALNWHAARDKQERMENPQIWLLGHPPLSRFLDFATDTAPKGVTVNRVVLTAEWRAANARYEALEQTEAGIANQCELRELDPSLAALAVQVKSHSSFGHTFDILPTSFGMVELDRLVAYQNYLELSFVDAIKARIGPAPDLATLFRVCFPLDEAPPPVEVRRVSARRYIFRSESTHFRFREPALLRADQANGSEPFSTISGIVGMVVGFRANLLNVVRIGNRMLLNNGYHRACALRALGVTHVPCVIQTATHLNELQLVVNRQVAEDPSFYFESARPPLVKDYFDPRIAKLMPTRKRIRQIEVEFNIGDYLVPE